MFIKVLLFLLVFGQSVAGAAVLTEVTARLTKTEIAQGDFQQEKHLKFLRKQIHLYNHLHK